MKNLCILLILLIFFSYTPLSFTDLYPVRFNRAETIIVPDNYSSIQEAVNHAKEGQEIFVRSGVYKEYIVINKTLSICGENRETTIIEGNGSHVLITLYHDHVNISSLWLRNAETAIYLKRTKNCRIVQNKITDIKMNAYAGTSSGTAIYLYKSNNTIIEENSITSVYYTHLFLEGANHNQIRDNLFISNTRWGQALLLRKSHNNLIEWNKVYGTSEINEGGIGAIHSTKNVIQFNDIKQNDWCGISLYGSNGTVIRGNNITDHRILFGIYLERSENSTIYCNNFVNNVKDVEAYKAKNTTWSFEGLGNYWDKYRGVDKNHDGIGDAVYGFQGQNDTHPLMGKYFPFQLHFNNKVVNLEVISNSTIWLDSSQPLDKGIIFKSRGQLGDYTFCLIKIPTKILENFSITVNSGNPLIYKKIVSSQEFSMLYILYIHEFPEDVILIIPEFPVLPVLAFLFVTTTLMLLHRKLGKGKRIQKKPKRQ